MRFPGTMVDSITPATDEALRERVRAAIGLDDAWPVQRERFTQWVIEDRLGTGRAGPRRAGVSWCADVRPFEQAKLRLLNGAHSTLAYLGLLAGLETVAEAMADPALAGFVERLMRDDIAPSLPPTAGLDLAAYIASILARFRNPAIAHQLVADRLGRLAEAARPPAGDHRRRAGGRAAGRSAGDPGGRLDGVRGPPRRSAEPLVDPLADAIGVIAAAPPERQADLFLAMDAVFPPRACRRCAFSPGRQRGASGADAGPARRVADALTSPELTTKLVRVPNL